MGKILQPMNEKRFWRAIGVNGTVA